MRREISLKHAGCVLAALIVILISPVPNVFSGGNLTFLGSALLTEIEDIDFNGHRVLAALTGGVALLYFSDQDRHNYKS